MKKYHIALLIIVSLSSFVLGHVTNCREGKKKAHDYSLDVDNDGSTLVDNGKIVGRLNYGDNPTLDSLVDKDNQ